VARQHVSARIVKFERKSETFRYYELPGEANIDAAQINMVSPRSSHVDGKLWTQNNGFAGVPPARSRFRQDRDLRAVQGAPKGEPHNIYDVIPDSKNNAFLHRLPPAAHRTHRRQVRRDQALRDTDPGFRPASRHDGRSGSALVRRIPRQPHRHVRHQDRDRSRSGLRRRHGPRPYDATIDKNGEAWTGSMSTDRILRLNPESGEFVEYLLPRSTNIRACSSTTARPPVTFWVGNNHGASIIRLEPLE
jgi:hypothetical protein